MAFLVVNPNGKEIVFQRKPTRRDEVINKKKVTTWYPFSDIQDSAPNFFVVLPSGSIKKLIGREITWENEPIEI